MRGVSQNDTSRFYLCNVTFKIVIMKKQPFEILCDTLQASDNKKVSKKQTTKNSPACVLEAFEYIVELAEDSNLNNDFFTVANPYIRYVSRKLKLSVMQSVMLALFVDRSEDNCIRLSEIAQYVGCRTTKFLRLSKDIDALEKMHYLIASRSQRSLSYRVPSDVLNALKENMPYVYEKSPIESVADFFDYFSDLIEQTDNDELPYDSLMSLTREASESISESYFMKKLRSYNLIDDEELLFIYMAHLYIENNDDSIRLNDIDDIYDQGRVPYWIKMGLRNRGLEIFRINLIENSNEDGMARADAFKLTDYAKNDLLSEICSINTARNQKDLIKCDSFAEKRLIYNSEKKIQIEQLTAILSESRFKEVQDRLVKAGMRKGFCCLFYGAPGTGKTETVYQLARLTGRDIMRVDVDKVKSCWVGESEKNIKSIFDRYRNLCKQREHVPILLFNEADAVLGVRMEGAAKAVDKMENSIQNIILQEMETLDGIMIATTNLTNNLDKAFERRFLYKIRFERPTLEGRILIWKTMLPLLSDKDARKLATECDLSGGEIENVVRKHSVQSILYGQEITDIDAILKICQSEHISPSRPQLGFQ